MLEKQTEQVFLKTHRLPATYLDNAKRYFDPVAQAISNLQGVRSSSALLVALSGCQGSGKSTLAEYLALALRSKGLKVLVISLDDFYLSKSARAAKATDTHALFATRGVPGTHDTDSLLRTLQAAKEGSLAGRLIPRFDKSRDDLYAQDNWTLVDDSPDVLILEGWCLGIEASSEEDLISPCNEFEATHDADGSWRKSVNDYIASEYAELQELFDVWLFLRAPGFDSVYEWRLEQEEKMRQAHAAKRAMHQGSKNDEVGMTPEEVDRFIQHYQRLTERLLKTLPGRADVVWELDNSRKIQSMRVSGQLARYSLNKGRES